VGDGFFSLDSREGIVGKLEEVSNTTATDRFEG